ncbi:MAG TPA: desulfoferrodoxin family protein [Acidobacteriota bacterium]|nr:desulfoferrodoxin family protein [Acidobacteriota bacterium]
MKKRSLFLIPVVLVAAAVMLSSVGRATPSAQAQEEYKQDKPYTRADPGPWVGAADKHIPEIVYEKLEMGLKVTVKVDNHPMDPMKPHYIMWIRLEDGQGNVLGKHEFAATDLAPVATFELKSVPEKLAAFERCNIHGIWMNEANVELK